MQAPLAVLGPDTPLTRIPVHAYAIVASASNAGPVVLALFAAVAGAIALILLVSWIMYQRDRHRWPEKTTSQDDGKSSQREP